MIQPFEWTACRAVVSRTPRASSACWLPRMDAQGALLEQQPTLAGRVAAKPGERESTPRDTEDLVRALGCPVRTATGIINHPPTRRLPQRRSALPACTRPTETGPGPRYRERHQYDEQTTTAR